MNRAYIYIIGVCALLLTGMTGCNNANMDLCYDQHPHRGQLIVEYDWSGLEYEKPDSMIVMAVRPVFRTKMASNWATTVASGESRLYGRLIAPFGLDFSKPMNYEEGDSEVDGDTDSEVDSDTEIGVDGDAEGEVEDGSGSDGDITAALGEQQGAVEHRCLVVASVVVLQFSLYFAYFEFLFEKALEFRQTGIVGELCYINSSKIEFVG